MKEARGNGRRGIRFRAQESLSFREEPEPLGLTDPEIAAEHQARRFRPKDQD